jgi:WD40 repeat protein
MSEPSSLVEVLLRQREAWQVGRRPSVEDLLREHPHLADNRDAVLDLVYNERLLCEERGESGALKEYQARFPHLAAELQAQFEVDQALTMDELASSPQGSPGALPSLDGCDLLDELGRGAMGVVYRGWQRGAKRLVAVKLLSGDMPAGRIGAEVEAISRLSHPNIVQVFAVCEHRGQTALVLEHVEGGTLAQKLASRPQPPGDAARLVEVLAEAMAYAHGRGVVHRDLKPGNVLLSAGPGAPLRQCVPKIGDFGLARLMEAASGLTRTSDVLGTPSYMAPEQTGGRAREGAGEVGPAADVYALGAIFYECLTGRPPFLGQSVLDTLEQVRNQEPVPPSQLQAKVPRDLEVICLKCLHKSPSRRYAGAGELAADLGRFLRGEPIQARPVGVVERLAKWSRRRPAAAALVLVCLAAALLLGLGGLSFNQVVRRQRDVARSQASALDTELQRTRRLLYTAVLLRVGSVWESDPAQGLRMLEDPVACPPDLRCFSWGVLHAQCKRYRRSLTGHASAVTALAISADGKLLASGDQDGEVRLWDARSGAALATLREHRARISALAFAPDGSLLASADLSGRVHLTNVAGRTLHGSLPAQRGRVAGIAFHPDGRTLAVNAGPLGGHGTASLWDVRSLRLRRTLRGETDVLSGIAISPDGGTVACGQHGQGVRLWSAGTGRAAPSLRGPSAPVTCLLFAAEGKRLIAGSLDRTVRTWDLGSGAEVDSLEVGTGPVTALALHRGGQTLAVAAAQGDGDAGADVQLWDLLARRGGESLRGHLGGVAALAFSPDGATLATAGADATVKLCDHPPPRDTVALRGHVGGPGSVALARDGRTLAWIAQASTSGAASEIHVHDLDRGATLAVLRGHGRPVRCLALSPDGGTVVSAAGRDGPAELLVWKVAGGRPVQGLGGHAAAVTAVAFSPDGRSVASAGADGTVKVHDVASGAVRWQRATTAKPALAVAFSADGRSLAVGGGQTGRAGALDVFEAGTGSLRHTLPTAEAVTSLALSADGELAAHAGKGGEVYLVDVGSGETHHTLAVGMKGIACLALSPDGQTLAVAGSAAGVKLWDVPTGQERASLPRHPGGACFVAFDGTGGLLVTAGATRQARLWRRAR